VIVFLARFAVRTSRRVAFHAGVQTVGAGMFRNRVGTDLERQGLYLDVPAYAAQIFRFTPGN